MAHKLKYIPTFSDDFVWNSINGRKNVKYGLS